MMLSRLINAKLIKPPGFALSNLMFETLTGSHAYGIATAESDFDYVGFCIPPKEMVFPTGYIEGFSPKPQPFKVFTKTHLMLGDKECDISIYSIIPYFRLCMECNPNMIDTLFTSQDCITHITQVGQMVREQRHLFLHKGAWHKFKGYAYSQLHKMSTKNPEPGSNREAIRQEFGFDVKFAYNIVRLLYEAEMILTEEDIDLRRHSEHLKAIRRGEVSQQDIVAWAASKEKDLELVYTNSKLRYGPDVPRVTDLLLDCLEHHYGDLPRLDSATRTLEKIREIINTQ